MSDLANFVITLLASASVSAALAGALVWLLKDWVGERMKNAIKHEYDQRLESYKAQVAVENDREIERLRAELAEATAEKDARRDYEYEARKKLYAQYEPLLFQLIERSEDAYYRVISLARTAREGKLTASGDGWLQVPDYYLYSTLYKLLAPVALFKVIQRGLTFVDLSVDPRITANYTLAKVLYITFTSDFDLARQEPAIPYDPHGDGAARARRAKPHQFWRQGVPLGCLDNVLDDCLLGGDGQTTYLRTFGDFERIVKQLRSDEQWHDIRHFFEIFEGFYPSTRPVLWRVLITQAHLHRLLMGRIGSTSKSPFDEIFSNLALPEAERQKLQWSEEASGDVFDVSCAFIRRYLGELRLGS